MSARSCCGRSRLCIPGSAAERGRRASIEGSGRRRAWIPNSQTDTFAAVTFFIDNWRWEGVPFYIRSGKKLPRRTTDIAIQFNNAPHAMFTAH